MTQLDIIVKALENLGGKAAYKDIYEEFERLYGSRITVGQKAGIRKNIEDHSSDSQNYKGKDDLFYSAEGIGSGVWGLRK